MSYLTEKVSYLKGLAEGMELDTSTKEGKLLKAIIDALEDTADAIGEVVDIQDEMQLQLDDVDDDLAELETAVYEDEYYDDEDEEFADELSVECPECHDLIYVDDDYWAGDQETITCPSCGEVFEPDFNCGCDCDCDCED